MMIQSKRGGERLLENRQPLVATFKNSPLAWRARWKANKAAQAQPAHKGKSSLDATGTA